MYATHRFVMIHPCANNGIHISLTFLMTFLTVSAIVFTFHINIPCDNTFGGRLSFWPWHFSYFLKELMLVITFILYIHEHFLRRYSTCFKIFVLLILVVIGIGHFLGHLCFTNTYVKSVVFFLQTRLLISGFFSRAK